MFTSLKARLALLALFCAFLSIFAISFVLISEHSLILENSLLEDLEDTVNIKQGQLAHHLEMIERSAAALGNHPRVTSFFKDEQENEELRALFQSIQLAQWGVSHHMLLINPEGSVIYSPNKTGSDMSGHYEESVASSPFFAKGKETTTVTDFFGFRESNHFHQIMFVPVKEDGSTLGVVGIEVCIDFFDQVFQESLEEKGLTFSLVALSGEKVVNNVEDLKPAIQTDALETAREDGIFKGLAQGLSGKDVYAVYLREQQWPWILCLEQDASRIQAQIVDARNQSLILAGIVLTLAGLLGLWVANRIAKPVVAINQGIVYTIEQNDLTTEMKVKSSDEIGRMATALNGFFQTMRQLVAENKQTSTALTESAGRLQESAGNLQQLSSVLEDEHREANSVSHTISNHAQELTVQTGGAREMVTALNSATEKMGEDLNRMSSLAEESDEMVNRTESALQRLRDSIQDVSRNTDKGTEVRQKIIDKVEDARTIMDGLDRSSQSVDEITRVIEKLADQTSLLALNATIEAEKAGAAGKSFGVVALDIKNLATQSRTSAEQITAQIKEIQTGAKNVGTAMSGIFSTISELHKMGEEAATAMDHQISTIHSVSEIVSEESSHLGRITKGVTNLATGVVTILQQLEALIEFLGKVDESAANSSQLTEQVRGCVEKMGASCSQLTHVAVLIQSSTEDMNRRFNNLDQLVAPYKTDM